jgi:flagellar biosynthesis component FlhA
MKLNLFEYYDKNNIKDMLMASVVIFALLSLCLINKYLHYGLTFLFLVIIFFLVLGLYQKNKEEKTKPKEEVKNETQETKETETKENKLSRKPEKPKDLRF